MSEPMDLQDLLDAVEEALAEGRLDEAESWAREAVRLGDSTGDAQFLLGEVLQELGRPEEAELAYKEAVLVSSENAPAWAALGGLQYEGLRWDEARRSVNRAIREDPTLPDPWYLRAQLRERRGDGAGAWRDYLRAWGADPGLFPLPTPLDDLTVEAAIDEALSELDPTLQSYLDNVAILVEDVPTEDILRSMEPPASPSILGYFAGASLRDRGAESPWAQLPATIRIFRRNLERVCRSREELVEELRVTLYHEVGHYLGLDEDDLERRGLD